MLCALWGRCSKAQVGQNFQDTAAHTICTKINWPNVQKSLTHWVLISFAHLSPAEVPKQDLNSSENHAPIGGAEHLKIWPLGLSFVLTEINDKDPIVFIMSGSGPLFMKWHLANSSKLFGSFSHHLYEVSTQLQRRYDFCCLCSTTQLGFWSK